MASGVAHFIHVVPTTLKNSKILNGLYPHLAMWASNIPSAFAYSKLNAIFRTSVKKRIRLAIFAAIPVPIHFDTATRDPARG